MRYHQGFTIFDSLLTVALMAVLIGVALPNISYFLAAKSSDTYAYTVWRTLAKTREEAISSGQRTTFCGVDANQRCIRDNIHALMIFHDTNDDQQRNNNEPLLKQIDVPYSGTIKLRASNQKQITFSSHGYALQFGSIVLCHASKNSAFTRRISVNRGGRSYIARVKPGQDAIKNADGTDIDCD